MNKNLSIILPTLNESKNLESLIPEIVDIISSRDISNYEILIVDDGSVDDSNEVCNELNKEYGNIKFVNLKNMSQHWLLYLAHLLLYQLQ